MNIRPSPHNYYNIYKCFSLKYLKIKLKRGDRQPQFYLKSNVLKQNYQINIHLTPDETVFDFFLFFNTIIMDRSNLPSLNER